MNQPDVLMDETEARRRVNRIRIGLEGIADEVIALQRGQGWLALGYPTWAELCIGEFPFRLALPKDERRELVGPFTEAGMSAKSQAEFFGVSERTIHSDRAGTETISPPDKWTGQDGKEYRRTPPPNINIETGEVIDPYANWTEDEHLIRKQLEAGQTVVISLRPNHDNLAKWAEAKGLLTKIDRRTDWGNPFEIPDDGDRATVIAKYETHYLPHKTALLGRLSELRSKALACWCAPEPCHGDILKTWAER